MGSASGVSSKVRPAGASKRPGSAPEIQVLPQRCAFALQTRQSGFEALVRLFGLRDLRSTFFELCFALLEQRFEPKLFVESAETFDDRIGDQHVAIASALARPRRSRDPRIGQPAGVLVGVEQ